VVVSDNPRPYRPRRLQGSRRDAPRTIFVRSFRPTPVTLPLRGSLPSLDPTLRCSLGFPLFRLAASLWASLASTLRRTTLQDQVNRLFNDVLERTGEESSLTAWAPSVDIYETEHELVVKADLPDVDPKDLDIRVENNILTIRGERKFEKNVSEENYLRVERSYGSFARSFTLASTVNSEAIKADYQNGVLKLSIPKKEEAKPKQIKVNVGTPAMAASSAGR
jgi:HSP20 family protein